ncbi:MAG: hypothetical protein EOM83_14220 [Clostridia bacterium]|nr:hypothetical protein [Clostridia bacterium]
MKNYQLDSLILENFKTFKGQHIFDFNELNIYTGANNSGKSTIIKAIQLFSKGLEKGDFPMIDLMGSKGNFGEFNDLVNWESKSNNFKIGFFITIGKIETPFKVLFTFRNGEDDGWGKRKGMAVFSEIEIINERDEVFCGIYNSALFKVDEANIEFDIDKSYRNGQEIKHYEIPFKSPSENDKPGMILLKVNVPLLETYINKITDEGYKEVLEQLNNIKTTKKNNWWVECYDENDFHEIDYDLSRIKLRDYVNEIIEDKYLNFGDYKIREEILLHDDTEFDEQKYSILKNTGYDAFVKDVIGSVIFEIDDALKVFRGRNIVHVAYQHFNNHLIEISPANSYLRSVFDLQEKANFIEFIYDSLQIFGIDGIINIEQHQNSFFELMFMPKASRYIRVANKEEEEALRKEFNLKISKFNFSFGQSFDKFKKEYLEDPNNKMVNIADLGKGAAHIIGIVLNVASILFIDKKEKYLKEQLTNSRNKKPEQIIQKTILIEEPETFLHPSWQARLADYFIFCINFYRIKVTRKQAEEQPIRFIIETHSVYLIQKLQLLVARDKFDAEAIDILYFNDNDQTEKCYKIPMRTDGILEKGFGTGFYDETANLTADILNAQKLN